MIESALQAFTTEPNSPAENGFLFSDEQLHAHLHGLDDWASEMLEL